MYSNPQKVNAIIIVRIQIVFFFILNNIYVCWESFIIYNVNNLYAQMFAQLISAPAYSVNKYLAFNT